MTHLKVRRFLLGLESITFEPREIVLLLSWENLLLLSKQLLSKARLLLKRWLSTWVQFLQKASLILLVKLSSHKNLLKAAPNKLSSKSPNSLLSTEPPADFHFKSLMPVVKLPAMSSTIKKKNRLKLKKNNNRRKSKRNNKRKKEEKLNSPNNKKNKKNKKKLLSKWKLDWITESSISEQPPNKLSLDYHQESAKYSDNSSQTMISSRSILLNLSQVVQKEVLMFLVYSILVRNHVLLNHLNFISKCVLWEISNVCLKLVLFSVLRIRSLIVICVSL